MVVRDMHIAYFSYYIIQAEGGAETDLRGYMEYKFYFVVWF